MHEKNQIDALTPSNKELLGLENTPEDTNTENFAQDYKEINELISEIIKEV
jgi:hypothetical protein